VRLLAAEPTVLDAVRSFADTGRLLAAICAAPLILHAAGVIEGRRIACHPSIEASLSGAIVVREPVVVDGHIVTSRGAGTAIEFALRILDLTGQESAATGIASAILHERYPHC
jgi:4-methyl-5(b-hydroxyethyl)-thiazole monophosphate biosynthesis